MIYRCNTCEKLKWHTDFGMTWSNENNKDYRRKQCYACQRKKHAFRVEHNLMYRMMRLLQQITARSKKKGIACDLDLTWLMKKAKQGICEVTGIKLNFSKKGKRAKAYGGSVDRKDSSKGYTKDNCQFVCWIYNRAKGSSSHELVIEFAKALLQNE